MIPYGKNIYIDPDIEQGTLITSTKSIVERGKVLAVGSEVTFVKPGDVILFSGWGANKVVIEGKDYYFVAEHEQFLLGKL